MSQNQSTNYNSTQRNLWQAPWGYVESFFIVFGAILIGFLWQISLGNLSIEILAYPTNIIVGLIYIFLLILLQRKFSNILIIKWFTSIPATIVLLSAVLLMVLIMGTIPQSKSESSLINTLGLNQITSHWSFYIIQFLLLTTLGMVTIKRSLPFYKHNIGFILNHAGLFIALLAGLLGASDVQKWKMIVTENKSQQVAINDKNELKKMDFQVYLHDFHMEEYLPKVTIVDNTSGKVVLKEQNIMIDTLDTTKFSFQNYEIEVEQYLSSAGKIDNKYVAVKDLGTPPAALLKIKNLKNNEIQEQWLTCGSFLYPFEAIKLSDEYSVLMTFPEPKKFTSTVDFIASDSLKNITIEVNKPVNFEGWKIYQLSYDEEMGKWSQTSTFELVRDPWLLVIYTGIFMMIAGAIYLFWKGPNSSKTSFYNQKNK